MCIVKLNSHRCKMINRSKLGSAVRGVLTEAKAERRLVCGLLPSISHLEKAPEDVLLCVVPQARPGDAASHMQAVLLQAFCYENYIPVIQVDNIEKLSGYCGFSSKEQTVKCQCAIITKNKNTLMAAVDYPLSPSEQVLADFYECTLQEFPRPIIDLPI